MTGQRALVKDRPASFPSLETIIAAAAEAIRPPERLTVTEAAVKYVRIKEKNYSGPWSVEKTPYLVEPQNELMSLDFTGMVFVGPARTGKSQMFLNWLAATAICDPMDMMLLHMSQATARNWSLSDLAKMIRHSPDFRSRLVAGRQQDNVYDKAFVSGMRLQIIHPSINELSGKTVGRNWAMDYDRLPPNIDGEGDAWTLLKKRAQTLKRYGMTAAESSPGFPVLDGKWIARSPHEAPPCEGILSLYNDGDRRRWYWRCPQCRGSFEPHRKLLVYPKSADPMESAEQVVMACPHDGFPMTPDFQHELNLGGRWIKEGQHWLEDGSIVGTPRRSDIASFWMFGPAAAFTSWPELVLKRLNAEADFERTGSEEKLKAVTNTDDGEPYTPKALEAGRLPEELKARARPYSVRGQVPEGVRFLITTIDVQKNAFVCHTYGIEPVQMGGGAWSYDVYHVDMWRILKSRRLDEDAHPLPIDPPTNKEDWHVLIDEVIERSYPLADGSGRHMQVKLIACDSGGAASVTAARLNAALDGPTVSTTSNAYDFWRFLRDDPAGRNYHSRFHLLKGEPSRSAPSLLQTFPDSQQKDRYAVARGDVPVWAVNSNVVKDAAHNMLGRAEPGGRVHFPLWFEESGEPENIDWLYSQLTTEVRLPAGWRNLARRKNEAFDLLAYLVAFMKHPQIRIEHIKWSSPPGWAADWDKNDLVFTPIEGRPFAPEPKKPGKTLAELAQELA